MGQSYIQVYLDTTPPQLTLYFPHKTTQESTELISIHADENLSSNQEIIIIDSQNNEHHYTFTLSADKRSYSGTVSFANYPLGITTINVRLYDEVNNPTSTYQETFLISSPTTQSLLLTLNEFERNLQISLSTRKLITTEREGI